LLVCRVDRPFHNDVPAHASNFPMTVLDRLFLRFSAPPRPAVFVSGMPKSGTTAILRLMGLASGQSAVNDPFYKLDLQGIQFRDELFSGQIGLVELMRRYPRIWRGQLVKDPNLVFFYEHLSATYPAAGWVFTIRDPRDNIRSILNRLQLPGRVAAMQPLLSGIPDTWRRVLDGRSPDFGGNNPIEAMARRWARMAERMQQAGASIVVSKYEDFMRDKSAHIAAMCRAVDLEPKYSISEHVDTQFQPKGDRRAVWSEFFGPTELKAIEETCGPWLAAYGYESGTTSR
jgi:hypothetical protein